MQFFGKIIEIFDAKMDVPGLFGWFHLLFLALSVIFGVLLLKADPKGTEKFARKMLLAVSLTVIVLEIYKQICFTFDFDGVAISGDYMWYAFPFQFCSTPMYVGLGAALIRNEKIHKALCAYLATFSVFAGVCVMIYPGDVFVDIIGINVQTMICHGTMISQGIYLLGTNYVKREHKTILKAIPVFVICIAIAIIMNEIAYFTGLLETDTFNMFFISPHCEGTLPVYSIVQKYVPFPFCTVIYALVFSLAAYLILLISTLPQKLRSVKKEKIKQAV